MRGIVPDQLDARVTWALGAAFADVVVRPDGATACVIAHDMRDSSPELSGAFADGVAAAGSTSSPPGSRAPTGSTTPAAPSTCPARCSPRPTTRPPTTASSCAGPAPARSARTPAWPRSATRPRRSSTATRRPTRRGPTRRTVSERDLLADYADVPARPGRPDRHPPAAGGRRRRQRHGRVHRARRARTGGLPALPLDVIPLYFELDGTFPNHEANPLDPANLVDLQAAVVEHGADIGLAFDGDADRCFVIDENGDPVSPSAITALVARREVARAVAAGADAADVTVLYNLISSARCPRSSPQPAARGCAPGSATPSSRPRWPPPTRCSAASTPRTTTSATSGSPTPACSPRCTCSPRSASRTPR